MITAIDLKDARIEFKTSKKIKQLLQEASHSLGMDLSSFLISTAIQKAKEIIKEDNLLTLSQQEWKSFQNILDTPQEPSSEFKQLMKLKDFEK